MTEQRLAPCPFCASEDLAVHKLEGDSRRNLFYAVTCLSCDCRLAGKSEIEVVDKWNVRTPERLNKVLSAKLRRLEAMLDDRYMGRISPEAKRTMMLNKNRR